MLIVTYAPWFPFASLLAMLVAILETFGGSGTLVDC
jgi:hypothetical protein